jgi:hypothetical protein
MGAVVVELADAVTAALNAAGLSLPFTATRGYIPSLGKQDEDVDELAALTVVVVPSELSFAIMARGGDDFDYVIDVGIFQRIDDEDPASIDALMALAEEIGDLLRGSAAIDALPARFIMATNSPIFDQDMMRQQRLFASAWRLTFRQARPKS